MLSLPVHVFPGDHNDLRLGADQLVWVRAVDDIGRPGCDIEAASGSSRPPARPRDGSDAASFGARPRDGIFDTQLGPNRNGASRS